MERATHVMRGIAVAGLLVAALAACGDSSERSSTSAAAKVGVVYDIGGRGDKSFNDGVAAGIDESKKKYGVTVKELSPNAGGSDREELLRLLAEGGHDPIICVGFLFEDSVRKLAPSFPETHFAIVDNDAVEEPNVAGLVFNEEQASYLVGAAAAKKSKSGHIGIVLGVQIPPQQKFEAGYVAGARRIDPDITVDVKYLTQAPDFSGFSSPDKARESANGMIDAGADVIYHAAGASGAGVIQAATEGGVWAIGVDSDQYLTATKAQKDHILTSGVKRLDVAITKYIGAFVDGKPLTGSQRFGLKDGGVTYATSGGFVDDIESELEDLRTQIIDGAITVPTKP